MSRHTLKINTFGICTHFGHGVVSGVPHRVVLPNAARVMAGLLTVKEMSAHDPSAVFYYLIPHFARLEMAEVVNLNIPGLLNDGDIQGGLRLQVINCVDSEIDYRPDHTPRLTEYVPGYTFSDDVVLHGRAACYLDVYGGTVVGVPPDPATNKAGYVTIEMQTEGPPELLVTPLAPWTEREKTFFRLAVPAGEITLKNTEFHGERGADDMSGGLDYLLHYLTARGGIPQSIATRTPGMPCVLVSADQAEVAAALKQLARWIDPTGKRTLRPPEDLTASCSPSEYP